MELELVSLLEVYSVVECSFVVDEGCIMTVNRRSNGSGNNLQHGLQMVRRVRWRALGYIKKMIIIPEQFEWVVFLAARMWVPMRPSKVIAGGTVRIRTKDTMAQLVTKTMRVMLN